MVKIDLEKSLIRENKKTVVPKELLLINEYDKFTAFVDNDVLSRVGLNRNLLEGESIKNRIKLKEEQTKEFDQKRVFHISQIEKICKRYRLKFLRTQYYKGSLDDKLPNKISNFEAAYNVTCHNSNTWIIAPRENFKLVKRPKDPLFFYEINNEYFYLIHKWGNDLNLLRTLLPLFENGLFCWLFVPMIFTPLLFFGDKGVFILLILFILSSFFQLVEKTTEGKFFSFLKPNNWNSHFDD